MFVIILFLFVLGLIGYHIYHFGKPREFFKNVSSVSLETSQYIKDEIDRKKNSLTLKEKQRMLRDLSEYLK